MKVDIAKQYIAMFVCLASIGAARADVSYEQEYLKRLKQYQTVQPLDPSPFGENISLYTGELGLLQTDITLEGTGPTIVLARERRMQVPEAPGKPTLGTWALSIPRIETLYRTNVATAGGIWKVGSSVAEASYDRCTEFGPVYDPSAQQSIWWQGYDLVDETGQRQPLLLRANENNAKPSLTNDVGQPIVFPAVTSQNWQIGCLSGTQNGQPGEGFLAVSPNGTKYWLNHLVTSPTETVEHSIDGINMVKYRRVLATMYVTRVEDRFGNWLTYQYDAQNLLTAINASDGRSVSFQWESGPRISTITVQPGPSQRIWQYKYAALGDGAGLFQVILPDLSYWQFNTPTPMVTGPGHDVSLCNFRTSSQANWGPETVWSVQHPSGLIGTFKLSASLHSRSYVDADCYYDQYADRYNEWIPPVFGTHSLVQKTLAGPGITTQTWNYAYSAPQGSTTADACAAANTCMDQRWVDVVDPDGDRTRYTLSTRWGAMEGKLLKTESYKGSTELLRTEAIAYAVNATSYPAHLGSLMLGWTVNTQKNEVWLPEQVRVVTQQGTRFVWEAEDFDAFARPTNVTKSSAPAP